MRRSTRPVVGSLQSCSGPWLTCQAVGTQQRSGRARRSPRHAARRPGTGQGDAAAWRSLTPVWNTAAVYTVRCKVGERGDFPLAVSEDSALQKTSTSPRSEASGRVLQQRGHRVFCRGRRRGRRLACLVKTRQRLGAARRPRQEGGGPERPRPPSPPPASGHLRCCFCLSKKQTSRPKARSA